MRGQSVSTYVHMKRRIHVRMHTCVCTCVFANVGLTSQQATHALRVKMCTNVCKHARHTGSRTGLPPASPPFRARALCVKEYKCQTSATNSATCSLCLSLSLSLDSATASDLCVCVCVYGRIYVWMCGCMCMCVWMQHICVCVCQSDLSEQLGNLLWLEHFESWFTVHQTHGSKLHCGSRCVGVWVCICGEGERDR